ncbi:hypothetical protein INR49_020874 [Caranx melampygus]|nr:hypothetical protein INR49_020874 [Caranx melampygus]
MLRRSSPPLPAGLYKDQTPPTASNYHSQHSRSSGAAASSRMPPTCSSSCSTVSAAPACSCSSMSPRYDSRAGDGGRPAIRDVRATYRHLLDGCDFHGECEGRSLGRGPNTEL